ncbi:MAG TPA: PD-(D/E)XK nuclease family protein [Patescibacteria group bacterium]|nr:PD-(D/E)XK nuclease family protein [Patescibacteria group bacterium]
MFNNNRHLNIFEYYTQKGSLPIENNISRGLAILFNENNLILDRFIDMVNTKCIDKKSDFFVLKPQKPGDKDIGIQQQITKIVASYPNPQNIIGITLTTSSPTNWIENKKDDSNNLITDIVINCKDTLIVIEVKRNATDARLQLKQQVNSIISEVVKQGGNVPEKVLLDGTWEEVISMLQDVHALTGYNSDNILGHYLKHLENNYQEWFPISLLSDIEISVENQTAIDKRIHKLIRNCCASDGDEEQYSGRYIIPLNFDFAAEAQVDMDYRTSSLMVTVWPGDTKWQGYCLLNKTVNTLDWIYDRKIIVDEIPFKVITEPYLRLAHFQSSIIIEYLDKQYYKDNFGTDKEKCKGLFDDISREWKRHEWDELRHLLLNKRKGLINENSFNEEFQAKFENSNRSYVHVSFGYETTIYIPMDIINKYEKQGSTEKGKDKLAILVSDIITSLTDKIK